jgi:hypothetical protein
MTAVIRTMKNLSVKNVKFYRQLQQFAARADAEICRLPGRRLEMPAGGCHVVSPGRISEIISYI